MLSTLASLVVAANVVTPQPTEQLLDPVTQTPRLEHGVLSAPLPLLELPGAVRSWALGHRARYGLSPRATLRFVEAFRTRFGASFHLQQVVDDVDVYQAKLVVTLDAQRRVVQVASSLAPAAQVRTGEALTTEQALARAATALPLVALRPDGVPYGGAKRFFFAVGDELHSGWVANVQTLDLQKNWYVAIDAVSGAQLFAQNRVYHAALDAQVYPISPGGLDAGVGVTPTVTRSLTHADGGSMLGDTCVTSLADGGFGTEPNDAGQLCGTQLMGWNCCLTQDCQPDAGPARIIGATSYMGFPVQYNLAMCQRIRRASNAGPGRADFTYEPFDPPTNATMVLASDRANSDEFAEVHAFYHVNTVYDWVRRLSALGPPIFNNVPVIAPFQMRDEKRVPAVRPVVWANFMFPDIQALTNPASGACQFTTMPPGANCRSDALMRMDNAAFFPRENFNQLPIPGIDTGADTLLIFQGNQADAAYDATVIQHEFGHGVVFATANIGLDGVATDARSANNEGGAMHEGFADYIAAAFNEEPNVGPYFGPRALAGQSTVPVRQDGYLRSLSNTETCPSVLWGEVHQDSLHVSAALWQARETLFQGGDQGETFDAAFYAMLVSITPNADFAMMASTMAARVTTAFPGVTNAGQQLTQIFTAKGVIGCTKVLDATPANLPRPYYGVASASGALGNSLIPGPYQLRVPAAAGALRVRVTAGVRGGGGPFGGAPPTVQVMARTGGPITFARQGGTLQNNAERVVAAVANGNAITGTVELNAPCSGEIYLSLGVAGGGAALENLDVQVDPLVNCMIPAPDAGSGTDAGMTTDAGSGTGVTVIPAVGPNSTTSQDPAPVGCGCASGFELVPALALLAALARRRARR